MNTLDKLKKVLETEIDADGFDELDADAINCAIAEINRLTAENAELLKNKARLDFIISDGRRLYKTGGTYYATNYLGYTIGLHHTAYGAIDAAMEPIS